MFPITHDDRDETRASDDVPRGLRVLAVGHRPFFLLAALYGGIGGLVWLASLYGLLDLSARWQGHEMVFGFGTAALSGLVLSGVSKWTRCAPLKGKPLAVLIAFWLLGRVGMVSDYSRWLDVLYLPVLSFFHGEIII